MGLASAGQSLAVELPTPDPGKPMSAQTEKTQGSTGGAAEESAEAVAEVTGAASGAEAVSRAEYNRLFIGYNEWHQYMGDRSTEPSHNVGIGGPGEILRLYRGRYKKDLSLPEFLELVGRTDLKEQYEGISTTRWVVAGLGAATLIAGLVMTMTVPEASNTGPSFPPQRLVGLGTTFIGSFGVFFGMGLNPNSVITHTEIREYADRYNRKLKGEDREVAGDEVSALAPEVQFGISPVEGGAVAVMSGRF